jgi:hypothetical protein
MSKHNITEVRNMEMLQEEQDLESNNIVIDEDEEKNVTTNELDATTLIATLKRIKIEEQELLHKKEDLKITEKELLRQATTEIDEKKKLLAGLKSEVLLLQKKCNELEQALGIPSYE